MLSMSSGLRPLLVLLLLSTGAAAQRPGTGGSHPPTTSRTSPPPLVNNTPEFNTRPVFVSGRVVLEDGGRIPEPVAIERICNGVTRREGYTDFRGEFQLQIGSNIAFQDASENDPRPMPGVIPTRGISQGGLRGQAAIIGCEYRANLAGFQSSSVQVHELGESFQIELGRIVLKRMGDAKGSTVSATTMSAPKDAHHAYEKACKALQENRPELEQKELEKAVRLYPQFASAWSMLGDLEQKQSRIEDAKEAYRKAAAADPQYVNPIFELATIAVREKNWSDVAKFSTQAVSLNAYAFPIVYFYNALANLNLDQFPAAEENARKYKSLDKSHQHPEISLLLSDVLVHKQDFAGAAQQLREYLELVPNAPHVDELKARAKALEDQSLAKKQ